MKRSVRAMCVAGAGLAVLVCALWGRKMSGAGNETPVQSSGSTKRDQASGNRLGAESSPYLLQHASNPVDWYPWGEEAFARARREDKPIFLSVGYSACHWCHVMERESFENQDTADLLNQSFVSIKVDREERPDVDQVYMKAVQMMTGSGGWPMSVFLTPDLRPFYAGTYFPPDDRFGRPGFPRVVSELARLWREERKRVNEGAETSAQALIQGRPGSRGKGSLDDDLLRDATASLVATFDEENGGFGSAPKFPPATALRFLMRRYATSGDRELLNVVTTTLDRMARGGIYDHIGGGFHRYSVDAHWLVPHFEKMLYDNALLAGLYIEAYQLTRKPMYVGVARQTLDFLLREMRDEKGGFHAALDADSEGHEGMFYVWDYDEIMGLLGGEDGALFCQVYGVSKGGNFEGKNIPHLEEPLSAVAAEVTLPEGKLRERLDGMRARLAAHREGRIRPAKDDKVLTDWNGLALSAFAKAGLVLEDDTYLRAAREIAAFLLTTMRRPNGTLIHSWRNGQSGPGANLDDYAYLAQGLLDLYAADLDTAHIETARGLADLMRARFPDPDTGVFFYTEAGRTDLISREECGMDNARPAPTAMAADVMLLLSRLTDRGEYRQAAERALSNDAQAMRRFPSAYMGALSAVDRMLATPEEVVIAGPAGTPETQALIRTVVMRYRPDLILARWDANDPTEVVRKAMIPWLEGRLPVAGSAAAYYCRDRVCQAPVTNSRDLAELLDGKPK